MFTKKKNTDKKELLFYVSRIHRARWLRDGIINSMIELLKVKFLMK